MQETGRSSAATAGDVESNRFEIQNPFPELDDRIIHRLFAQWSRDVEVPKILEESKGRSVGMEVKLNHAQLLKYLKDRQLTRDRMEWINKGEGIDEEAYKADRFLNYWEALPDERRQHMIANLEKASGGSRTRQAAA